MTTNSRTPAKRATPRAAAQQNGHAAEAVASPEPEAPKSAPQREAEGVDTVTVQWRDLEFTVPSDVDTWNYWTVIVPLANGNETRALMGLLGNQQIAKLRQAIPQMTAKDGRELFDAVNDALGLNSGN